MGIIDNFYFTKEIKHSSIELHDYMAHLKVIEDLFLNCLNFICV